MSTYIIQLVITSSTSIGALVMQELNYAIHVRKSGRYYKNLDPVWIIQRLEKFEKEHGIKILDSELYAIMKKLDGEYIQSLFIDGYKVKPCGYIIEFYVESSKSREETTNLITSFFNNLVNTYNTRYEKINEVLM